MSLSPQLRPTDFERLETYTDREQREQAFTDNQIVIHEQPQGTRYTKGQSPMATKRSWQSLDAILRSDASASAALPRRELRISRMFTALTVVAGILTVAGTAASAREGLDLQNLNGTGGVLLGGGLATVGFGITAGIFYGKSKKSYEKAVEIYNDSLAVRLGLNTPAGDYIPPHGVLVDEDGFVVLDERERRSDAPSESDPGAEAPADASGADAAGADAAGTEGTEGTPTEAPALPTEAAPEPSTPSTPSTPVEPTPAPTEGTPSQTPPPIQTPTVQTPSTVALRGTGTGRRIAGPGEGEALELRPR